MMRSQNNFSILLTILAILGISVIGVACASVDISKDGKIIFSNGKVIEYLPKKKVNYPDKTGKIISGTVVSIEKKPVYVKEWMRLILFKTTSFIEDSTKEISIYDKNGDLLYQSEPFIGESLFLIETDRILLIQKSAHHKVENSYVLDANGKMIRVIKHTPNIFSFGKSRDDKTWWIMENGVENGNPYIIAKIYDFNGLSIDRFKSFTSKNVGYIYKDNKYTLRIPKPDFPG